MIPASETIKGSLFFDLLRVLKGLRGGLVYGAKVRLPHALVMNILFGQGT